MVVESGLAMDGDALLDFDSFGNGSLNGNFVATLSNHYDNDFGSADCIGDSGVQAVGSFDDFADFDAFDDSDNFEAFDDSVDWSDYLGFGGSDSLGDDQEEIDHSVELPPTEFHCPHHALAIGSHSDIYLQC